MKIALIGNMNNNFFAMTRYLRDIGYDAVLLYPDDLDHFLPHCDTYTLEYQEFTRELNWGQRSFHKTAPAEIEAVVKRYDVIIACGYAAAYLNRIKRPVDIYVPYGSDIYKYSSLKAEFSLLDKLRNELRRLRKSKYYIDMSFGTIHKHLREGIQNSKYLLMADTNPDFEAKYDALNIRGERIRLTPPFLYAPHYDPSCIHNYFNRSHWYQEFKKLRDANDIVVFHHSRHIWRTHANDFSYKGTDKLIKGFAGFVRARNDIRASLIMIEYGPDVNESKKLIKDLSIERNVAWFPKMYRKDLMIGLHHSDIATGEFDKSWLTFGTIMEAFAMAKPIIHHRKDDLYREAYPELYPLMNAYSADEIKDRLLEYASNPSQYKVMGETSRAWFQKYVVDIPLNEITARLDLLNSYC